MLSYILDNFYLSLALFLVLECLEGLVEGCKSLSREVQLLLIFLVRLVLFQVSYNVFYLVLGHVIVMGHFYNLPTGCVKSLYLHQHRLNRFRNCSQ